jgi:uncharacterized protein (TIGR02217 family)
LDYPYPLWKFELVFEFLRDTPTGSGDGDLRRLMGFFCACQGAYGNFLFNDPTDNLVTNQGIAIGDGTTTQFQFVRTLSDAAMGVTFTEPIVAPNIVFSLTFDGTVQSPSSYSFISAGSNNNANGILTFGTAPLAGVSINATFSYYFRCRFVDDSYAFEQFMSNLWTVKKLAFISVRP